MTDQKISIEEKAQYIHASDDIVVYASNKQVSAKMRKHIQYLLQMVVNNGNSLASQLTFYDIRQ